jgi:phosphoglucosamine mutase
MKELFGTDGIRGRAGEFPLDDRTVRAIGSSLARQFRERLGRPARFVSGRDTRESGEWIESAFHRGAAAEGAECHSAGVITTPGVAFLTSYRGQDAGVVISASHNPFQDNGIKVFLPSGKKIDETTERQTERDIYAGLVPPDGAFNTRNEPAADDLREAYIDHLVQMAEPMASRCKIVVDCANGAASALAPKVFAGLNAEIMLINNEPDGRNINLNCGSLHLEGLQERTLEERADLGVAFDGDADRALFVNENGEIVDGDAT